MTLRCAYCGAAIPKRVRDRAEASGETPRFCGRPKHRKLQDQRRARLVAAGYVGGRLYAELERLALAMRKGVRVRRKAAPAIRPEPKAAPPTETPTQSPQTAPILPKAAERPSRLSRADILKSLADIAKGGSR